LSNNEYIITDLNWFSQVLQILSNGSVESEKNEKINRLIGKNIRIWDEKTLKEILSKLISNYKVNRRNHFFFHLCDIILK
jgi:hypothetical protein